MKKNEIITAKVERYGNNGEGICVVDNLVVFVPYALIGETIEVKIIKVQKNYAIGKLMKVIEPIQERTNPVCGVFEPCGGCQLQHMNYETQLNLKTQTVKDAIERIGGFNNIEVNPCIGMDNPFQYRNKVQYPVGEKNGKLISGFYANHSHRIVETTCCPVQTDESEAVRKCVMDYAQKNSIKPYNEFTGKGVLRHIIVRSGKMTGELMVIIVINGKSLKNENQLVDELIEHVPNVVSIVINKNTKKTNVIMGEENRVIYGKSSIKDILCGLTFNISPHAFYQINPEQTEKLYNCAMEYAQLSKEEVVVDAYCGIGTISLLAAKQAKEVIGIEIVPQAIDDAKVNAKENNIDNVTFMCGKSEDVMPQLVKQGTPIDVVIVDPPRKGCDAGMLNAILEVKPKRVVYVSCNPATLARDIKVLCESGEYEVDKVQPVDMFPQTEHVETIVALYKKD